MIRAFCLWHGGIGVMTCDDVMQEVLASLWRHRHDLRPGASDGEERVWIRFHCRSVASHLRRKKNIATVSLSSLSTRSPYTQESDDWCAVDSANNRQTIEDLSSTLTPHERQVLQLMLDGYSNDEIAELLQIKPRSVTQTRWRIVKKMKDEIYEQRQHNTHA